MINEGASKSALFRNEGKFLYKDDYENSKALKWEYNEQIYTDAINNINSAMAILSDASSRASSMHISMSSPEGQELEAMVNSIFSNLASHVGDASTGINLCGMWATQRYLDGVEAGRCSLRAVDNINEIKERIRKNTEISSSEKEIKEQMDKIFYKEKEELQSNINKIKTIYAKINSGVGTGSLNSKGQSIYKGQTFLNTMTNCWEKLYKNGSKIIYTDEVKKYVPFEWSAENWDTNTTSYTDCSSMVSWMLYEYGYDEFGNRDQYTTYDYLDDANLDRWQEEYGWKVQNVNNGTEAANQVKSGDIVVYPHHMFVVKEVEDDGTIVTYDAGDQSHWVNEETKAQLEQQGVSLGDYTGSEEGTSSGYFSGYDKPGVIITVEDVSLDDLKYIN